MTMVVVVDTILPLKFDSLMLSYVAIQDLSFALVKPRHYVNLLTIYFLIQAEL